jgi:thiamine biosynthesis lipoprotein ApbE
MEIQEAWSIVKKMLPTFSNSFEEAAFHTLDTMIVSDKEKENVISVLNQVVGMVTAVRDVLSEEISDIQHPITNTDGSITPTLARLKSLYAFHTKRVAGRSPSEHELSIVKWCYECILQQFRARA